MWIARTTQTGPPSLADASGGKLGETVIDRRSTDRGLGHGETKGEEEAVEYFIRGG